MKKTILAVLMVVMVATPCLAQEEISLLNVDGTAWHVLGKRSPIQTPSIFAFDNDLVYWCFETEENGQIIVSHCEECSTSQYTNYTLHSSFSCDLDDYSRAGFTQVRGVMLPAIGFGWLVSRWCDAGCLYNFRLINETNDNWTPPGIE